MDAITMLKDDHKTVERLFKRFEKAGDNAYSEKRKVVDEIIRELAVHASVEEQIFYPVTRETVPKTEDIALESLEEHHIVKWVLSELDGMDPKNERFDAKVTVLIENVRHHVEEEEEEYFPMVRDELGRKALDDIGQALAAARKIAPTHPHPKAPDEPPGNLVAGTASGVVDRVGDTMSGIAQGGVSAVSDLVNRVLGGKRSNSPTGSPDARKTATKARKSASKAAATASSTGKTTARSAARGASKTAKAAKSGAKGTATSAKKSAKRTAATAKRAATTTGRTARSAAKRTTGTARRSASASRSR
ncbi:MAG: hemerythrin domain-containing protein [Acidimicrobiales bacterium]|nr:hemerythrin domain-containing protein [Acidimicrobiales bacterium]